MKKEYIFKVNKTYYEKLFIVIRKKQDVISILMNSLKYMLLNPEVDEEKSFAEIIVYVDKMSRIFFIDKTGDKYFSLAFPFTVKKEDGKYNFSFDSIDIIDNKLTSDVINFITCSSYHSTCSYEFLDPILEYQEKENEYIWSFLRRLFFMEDGYLRYDFDPTNYSKYLAKGEEKKHPLNHYDIFYSNNCTIKVGLKEKLEKDMFVKFTNGREDAFFIE